MPNNLENITLLYVEDEKSIRDELVEILQDDVFKLYVASNGEEGLELYREHKPDIIITDIRMPIMDGLTMSEKILSEDPSIPIIVASAFNDTEYLLKSIKLGIQHYSIKPINLKDLFSTLKTVSLNVMTLKRFKENQKLLAQYKQEVDKIAIVSKTDTDGIITYVNDAFCEISGYSREELLGKTHNVVKHDKNDVSLFKDIWDTILDKKEWKGVIRNRKKNANQYFVDTTIFPILNDLGEIEEFISIRKDITKEEIKKQNMEKVLDLSINRIEEKEKFIDEYENALDNNSIYCKTNVEGSILKASKGFINLLGTNSDLILNSSYLDLIDNSDIEKVNDEVKKSIETLTTWSGKLKHIDSKGNILYLQSSFIPIIDTYGRASEVLCLHTDLTEQEKLNHDILATQKEVISRMGAIGESRSKETGAHVKRVADYSKLLALKYGLSEKESEEIRMASPMHDIGKVAIPDSILNKPGKLTDEEFVVMKTHAQLGYEMLSGSDQPLLNTASIISQQHHEKWDGSGYPNGLKGENIHIYGRITAITDVFDALGHDRVYKKAWPLENILNLFKEESSKHFDPHLINLFIENLDEFLKIKKEFDSTNTKENIYG